MEINVIFQSIAENHVKNMLLNSQSFENTAGVFLNNAIYDTLSIEKIPKFVLLSEHAGIMRQVT